MTERLRISHLEMEITKKQFLDALEQIIGATVRAFPEVEDLETIGKCQEEILAIMRKHFGPLATIALNLLCAGFVAMSAETLMVQIDGPGARPEDFDTLRQLLTTDKQAN